MSAAPRSTVLLVVVLACLMMCAVLDAQDQPASVTTAPPQQEALPLTVLVQRCSPAVVFVEAQLASGVSQGSGVILDPTGKVLTCNHVIRDAKSVLVKTWNGGYFPAEGVLGVNPSADIAVLRLRAQSLPSVPLGDASKLLQGEKVFVISSPLGLENTASEGIVSGLRRVSDLPEGLRAELRGYGFRDEQPLIQFTAPTSPGSSGGPVFNGRGEVVGIVSLGLPKADNVYFAIPAKLAEAHLPSETVLKFDASASGMTTSTIGAANPKLGELPPSVGLLKPVETSCELAIPKGSDLSIRLKEGPFVLVESVSVSYSGSTERLTRVAQRPAGREFRPAPGGLVFFSAADAGRRVRIAYTCRAERVAILPVVNQSTLPEVGGMLREALEKGFTERGYEVIADTEVNAAIRAAGVNPTRGAWGLNGAVSPENVRTVAAEANAAIVVFSGIDTGSWNNWTKGVSLAVTLGVFDGHTGKDLYTQVLKDSRDTSWGSNKSGRVSLVNSLTERLLREFLGTERP